MKIPDAVRKTVGFVAYENKISGQIIPAGSCFFIGHDPKDGTSTSAKVYVATAAHVISALNSKGAKEVVLRLNKKSDGLESIRIPIEKWFTHPTDKNIDVAIYEMGIPAEYDHLVIPMSMCVDEKKMADHEIDLGDEVFVSGMFRFHQGKNRNIPIIRTGNLAALKEEKIWTADYGEIDGYLIESRSTGGLSGSPVFLNLGQVRVLGGELKVRKEGPHILLLGLIHGHFQLRGDDPADAPRNTFVDVINAGITIVVSVDSIRETIREYEAASAKAVQK